MDREQQELYREIIFDHDRHPRNYGPLTDPTHSAEGYNPLCGDRYRVFVRVAGGRLDRISFTGQGCAISRASASMMTTLATGLDRAKAESLIQSVEGFLTTGADAGIDAAADLVALEGVHRFPTRRACALLAWSALARALSDGGSPAHVGE